MAVSEKKSKLQLLKEEFLQTTDTLWQNEVNANLLVSKVMLATGVLAVVFLVLSLIGVFSISSAVMTRTLIQAVIELVVPSVICLALKGEKRWLKTLLMVFYTLVFARLEMTLGHNVVLCLAFPVVLSVRYYSSALTSFVAVLTVVFSGIAEYFGVAQRLGRIDLNMVELPAGTTLFSSADNTWLRDLVPFESLDYNQIWLHTLQHSYLPKLILFVLLALICREIAKRGRKAIFDQKAETEKSERLATELGVAAQIQNNVLPNIFPVYPDRKEFSLYASMTPAKEVGGDFYDFFMIDDNHIGLVIADVSGKGIPAALFMMVARTLIKNRTLMGGTPAEILNDVNVQLSEGNVAGFFVTVWLGIVDITTGKGLAANAGHEHPALCRHGEEFALVVYKHSLGVAMFDNLTFKEHEFQLDPGDTLFVYTDGVAEATNASEELFGVDRMLEALNTDPNAMPEQVLSNVKAGVDAFVAGAEQFDDLTMLCLKFFGPEGISAE